MMNTIAGWLGYVLNFIYGLVQNYGLAIIIFSILIRIVLLPLTIKQQNSTKKSAKIQDEVKKIQVKHAGNPEQINKATMDLYKREHFSPFSGCLTTIMQFILFISIFYLVSRPLTYMKKVDTAKLEDYSNQIVSEQKTNYKEIQIIDLFGKDDEEVNINMNFLGLDLSKVPTQNYTDPKIFLNIHLITKMTTTPEMKKKQEEREAKLKEEKRKRKEEREKKKEFEKELKKAKKEDKALVKEEIESNEEDEESLEDMQTEMTQMTKSMNYMMPLLSISIALIAPLGLSLYWLVSLLLQLSERFIINFFTKLIDKKREAKNNG